MYTIEKTNGTVILTVYNKSKSDALTFTGISVKRAKESYSDWRNSCDASWGDFPLTIKNNKPNYKDVIWYICFALYSALTVFLLVRGNWFFGCLASMPIFWVMICNLGEETGDEEI